MLRPSQPYNVCVGNMGGLTLGETVVGRRYLFDVPALGVDPPRTASAILDVEGCE